VADIPRPQIAIDLGDGGGLGGRAAQIDWRPAVHQAAWLTATRWGRLLKRLVLALK